jgi:hypothetical protein
MHVTEKRVMIAHLTEETLVALEVVVFISLKGSQRVEVGHY